MPLPLYLLAVAIFAMGTSEFMLGGITPRIAESLDVSLGTAGLLTSAFAVGMVVGAPAAAILVRRWAPRWSLLAFLAAFATSHVAAALTDRFMVLLAMRVLSAVANAGFLAVALATATALVGRDRAGRALSVLLSGTTLATIVGVPAGSLLGNAMGWRATFWAVASLCVIAGVGIALRFPAMPASGNGRSDIRGELCGLRRSTLLLMMTLGALVNAATFGSFTFLASLVTGRASLTAGWVPFALVIFGVGSFVGVTVAGRLSDRHPRFLILIGMPLLAIGWAVVAMSASDPGWLFPMLFLQGALAFGVGSTLIARVLHEAVGAPTLGGSYATVAFNVGAAAGPLLGGVAVESSLGSLGPPAISSGLTVVATALAVIRMRL
ncbi:Cmx/CmrA family chloramphenicol efflux MFS transporter [Flexivirga meconopsidis]|uniref:Cmx/CmrA family chloramphenicol efflux MFS transporter n=1 Tax=Flexivirga meconopsidis TaxID=2977121 RepID=UPI00223ED7E9|nr:Cmx/CmrA family chloramphenicol efflux MFS transporter [Flexivirga meconopsidis]